MPEPSCSPSRVGGSVRKVVQERVDGCPPFRIHKVAVPGRGNQPLGQVANLDVLVARPPSQHRKCSCWLQAVDGYQDALRLLNGRSMLGRGRHSSVHLFLGLREEVRCQIRVVTLHEHCIVRITQRRLTDHHHPALDTVRRPQAVGDAESLGVLADPLQQLLYPRSVLGVHARPDQIGIRCHSPGLVAVDAVDLVVPVKRPRFDAASL